MTAGTNLTSGPSVFPQLDLLQNQIGKGPCPTTKHISSKHDITRALNWKYCARIAGAVHDQAYSPNSTISKNCEGRPVSSVTPSCHFNQYHILRYNCTCLKALNLNWYHDYLRATMLPKRDLHHTLQFKGTLCCKIRCTWK